MGLIKVAITVALVGVIIGAAIIGAAYMFYHGAQVICCGH